MRSRSGIVVLLDVFVILVLVLTARLEDRTVQINVSKFNEYSISAGVTLIARLMDGHYEVLNNKNWEPVNGDELWRTEMLTADCDTSCEPFRMKRHVEMEYLLVGQFARDVAIQHANLCRSDSQSCASVKHFVSPDGYYFQKQ